MGKVIVLTQMSAIGWQEVLNLFLCFKRAQGRAVTTVEDYRKTVSWFFTGYPDAWCDPQRIRSATLDFMSRQENPNTYNLRFAYLKVFWDWSLAEGFYEGEHPLRGLKKKRSQGRVVRIEREMLQKLLILPDKKTWAGLRDYTLILAQLDTGIRPGEALQLVTSDVSTSLAEIRIRAEIAKTRSPRVVPLSHVSALALRKLLAVHDRVWGYEVPVFCSNEGRRLAGHSWAHRMKFYSKKLGSPITPYMLRHACALMYLQNGGDVMTLQRLLGHSDLTMTKRYLNIMDEDVRVVHETASPVAHIIIRRQKKFKNI